MFVKINSKCTITLISYEIEHILKKFNTCYIPIINCIKYFPLFFPHYYCIILCLLLFATNTIFTICEKPNGHLIFVRFICILFVLSHLFIFSFHYCSLMFLKKKKKYCSLMWIRMSAIYMCGYIILFHDYRPYTPSFSLATYFCCIFHFW